MANNNQLTTVTFPDIHFNTVPIYDNFKHTRELMIRISPELYAIHITC